MHFLLLFLHWLLDRLVPERRDGLTMAARADGRVEHMLARPASWNRSFSRRAREPAQPGAGGGEVRAGRSAIRPPVHHASDTAPQS